MSQLIALHDWLFLDLQRELLATHPDLSALVQRKPSVTTEGDLARVASELRFGPLQPWNDVISSIFALRRDLDELDHLAASVGGTKDERILGHLMDLWPVSVQAILESLRFVTRRLERARPTAFISKPQADALVLRLDERINEPALGRLRNVAAHGAHTGFGNDGWIENATNKRHWEVCALLQADDAQEGDVDAVEVSATSEIFGSLNESFGKFPSERHRMISIVTAGTAKGLRALVEELSGQILAGCIETRETENR